MIIYPSPLCVCVLACVLVHAHTWVLVCLHAIAFMWCWEYSLQGSVLSFHHVVPKIKLRSLKYAKHLYLLSHVLGPHPVIIDNSLRNKNMSHKSDIRKLKLPNDLCLIIKVNPSLTHKPKVDQQVIQNWYEYNFLLKSLTLCRSTYFPITTV